jgi:hypothetical protein
MLRTALFFLLDVPRLVTRRGDDLKILRQEAKAPGRWAEQRDPPARVRLAAARRPRRRRRGRGGTDPRGSARGRRRPLRHPLGRGGQRRRPHQGSARRRPNPHTAEHGLTRPGGDEDLRLLFRAAGSKWWVCARCRDLVDAGQWRALRQWVGPISNNPPIMMMWLGFKQNRTGPFVPLDADPPPPEEGR